MTLARRELESAIGDIADLAELQREPEKQPMDTNTPALASIGIDIGKEVFHIVGFGTNGKPAHSRDQSALFEFGTGFLLPETGAPKGASRRCLRAETGNRRPPHARNGRKNDLSASELSVAGFGRLGGGRTRARTWDPLIKSQPLRAIAKPISLPAVSIAAECEH